MAAISSEPLKRETMENEKHGMENGKHGMENVFLENIIITRHVANTLHCSRTFVALWRRRFKDRR